MVREVADPAHNPALPQLELHHQSVGHRASLAEHPHPAARPALPGQQAAASFTETEAIVNLDAALGFMQALKGPLDDFGTGFAAPTSSVPFALKIRRLHHGPPEAERSMVQIAQPVVAESNGAVAKAQ